LRKVRFTKECSGLQDQNFEKDGTSYKVETSKLFKRRRGLAEFLTRQQCFTIIYEEGKETAVGFTTMTEKNQEIPVSSGLLHIVERSSVLQNAFAELFRQHIGGKKVAFIIIFVVLAAFMYFYFTGKIDLRKWGIRI